MIKDRHYQVTQRGNAAHHLAIAHLLVIAVKKGDFSEARPYEFEFDQFLEGAGKSKTFKGNEIVFSNQGSEGILLWL